MEQGEAVDSAGIGKKASSLTSIQHPVTHTGCTDPAHTPAQTRSHFPWESPQVITLLLHLDSVHISHFWAETLGHLTRVAVAPPFLGHSQPRSDPCCPDNLGGQRLNIPASQVTCTGWPFQPPCTPIILCFTRTDYEFLVNHAVGEMGEPNVWIVGALLAPTTGAFSSQCFPRHLPGGVLGCRTIPVPSHAPTAQDVTPPPHNPV